MNEMRTLCTTEVPGRAVIPTIEKCTLYVNERIWYIPTANKVTIENHGRVLSGSV